MLLYPSVCTAVRVASLYFYISRTCQITIETPTIKQQSFDIHVYQTSHGRHPICGLLLIARRTSATSSHAHPSLPCMHAYRKHARKTKLEARRLGRSNFLLMNLSARSFYFSDESSVPKSHSTACFQPCIYSTVYNSDKVCQRYFPP